MSFVGEVRGRREHHRVAERAGEARLVTVREHVPAHVHEHEQVRPELAGDGAEAGRDLERPRVGIDQQHLLAEQLGQARFGEADAVCAHARARVRGEDGRGELARALDLVGAARPRQRIDRAALPGHSAEHRLGAVVEASVLGGGQRPHHVTAAADAEHHRPAGPAQHRLGVGHARKASAIEVS